ncbi:peptide deformylase [Desulfohalovibrio reitneri]|uniref:peptide deformylase n=1 Tax=Desulfohalovibrio reitneri TaxID=1307759 RepID=UPI0004A74931|nr:peptide deformylase [Desulfohalovibrio reitneri]
MPLEILSYPDPVLAKKAEVIEEITPELRQLAEDMLETMYQSEGIGLAAPQVGESIRLIVVDVTGPSHRAEPMAVVNPEIVCSDGEVVSEEGCLSVANYRCEVTRAASCTVRGYDLEGNPIEIEAEGLKAICLQHEIDHLDGVLFIDRISRLKRSLYDRKVKKWVKQAARTDD